MNKQIIYETPRFKEVEFDPESVLCVSERNADIVQLEEKYDWSGMWNN